MVVDGERETAPGAAGELLVGGACLALGYWGNPAATERSFVRLTGSGDRWYRTGDLVRRNDEGELEFLGRIDRQIKVRGVAGGAGGDRGAVLGRCPGVSDVVVDWDQDAARLTAYVVGGADGGDAHAASALTGFAPPAAARRDGAAALRLPRPDPHDGPWEGRPDGTRAHSLTPVRAAPRRRGPHRGRGRRHTRPFRVRPRRQVCWSPRPAVDRSRSGRDRPGGTCRSGGSTTADGRRRRHRNGRRWRTGRRYRSGRRRRTGCRPRGMNAGASPCGTSCATGPCTTCCRPGRCAAWRTC